MRRFRSTLQALLTVRQRHERLAMERYSDALRHRQRASEALANANGERDRFAGVLGTRLADGVTAAEAVQAQAHYRTLETRRESARQALLIAENAVPVALKAMLQSRREREAVEECITRQRQRHLRDQMTQERKLLDELALRRAGAVRTLAAGE